MCEGSAADAAGLLPADRQYTAKDRKSIVREHTNPGNPGSPEVRSTAMHAESGTSFGARARRYILTGVVTAIPIWVTWLIFQFFLTQLSKVGMPWVRALSRALHEAWPALSRWLLEPWFQSALAVLFTLLALYLLGWIATRVVGRRMIALFERLVQRIPLVEKIYGGTKQLLSVIQQKPGGLQRVVLIEFPSSEMKAVGFVMRTFRDPGDGRELAAVYVPTTPNPTSGYLEIVPAERLVPTDWTLDEAMTFIISGGAIAPEEGLRFERPAARS